MKKEHTGFSETFVAVLRGPDGRIKDARIQTTNPDSLLRRIVARVKEARARREVEGKDRR